MLVDKALLEEANKKFLSGDHRGAFECYETMLRQDPTNAILWNNRGLALLKMGQLNDASHSFDKANELNPNATLALYHKCLILMQCGKIDEAENCCDKIIASKPKFIAAKNLKVRLTTMKNEQAKILVPAASPAHEEQEKEDDDVTYEEVVEYRCPECDAVIGESDTGCGKCGAKFAQDESGKLQEERATKLVN